MRDALDAGRVVQIHAQQRRAIRRRGDGQFRHQVGRQCLKLGMALDDAGWAAIDDERVEAWAE
jgi:hypothetical protein